MTFLKEQAIRLLRTKWNSAQELAEELFAIFNNDRPMVVDGDLTVNGKITSNKDGQTTTIDPTVPDPEPDPIPPPPASVLFGDGADGDVTVNAEITLSRDMFYENLTLDSSAKINTNNYRIFVSGTLDLTNASANAINNNGIDGSYKDGETVPPSGWYLPVYSVATPTANTCGTGCRSGDGGAGSGSYAGGNATPQPAYTGIGGRSGPGGKGGDSNFPTAGKAGGVGQLCSGQTPVSFAQNTATYFTGTSYTRLEGGAGGGGGGAGGPYGGTIGSSGAAGGAGAGVVVLLAKTIQVGSGTAAGAISANGGKGGRAPYPGEGGVSLPGGGAGGGGGGGGGGYIYLVYGEILGTASSNWVRANGGKGGKGGDGTNSGTNTGLGGQGGNGGGSGSITYINYYTNKVTQQAKSSGIGDTPSIPVRSEGSQGSEGITNEASPT